LCIPVRFDRAVGAGLAGVDSRVVAGTGPQTKVRGVYRRGAHRRRSRRAAEAGRRSDRWHRDRRRDRCSDRCRDRRRCRIHDDQIGTVPKHLRRVAGDLGSTAAISGDPSPLQNGVLGCGVVRNLEKV
jgi:hypothetical protein